jgi:membrane glycosyltransferase
MSGTTPGGTSCEKIVHRRKVAHRRRVAGVIYRVLLIMGMLIFPLFVILILFTVQFRWWAIFFPTALILLGVLLAWYEYRLYKRL